MAPQLRHSGRKRRHEQFEPEPFAGLHGDDGAVALAVYGLAAMLRPAGSTFDETTQLVHWPGDDSDITVDRFDCRLLLDPSDLSVRRRPPPSSSNAAEEEAALDEDRYWDLRHPGPSSHATVPDEEGREASVSRSRDGYAAIGFSYGPDDSRQMYLPPPPPPRPPAGTAGSGETWVDAASATAPFSTRQRAIMQRTALFLHRGGTQAEAFLRLRLAGDAAFAFLWPQHAHHAFFQGLVRRAEAILQKQGQEGRPLDGTRGSGGESALATLAAYGDASDNDASTAKEETPPVGQLNGSSEHKVTLVITARLLKAVQRAGPGIVALISERLADDPSLQFLAPGNGHHDAFLQTTEQVLGKGGMEAIKKQLESRASLTGDVQAAALAASSGQGGIEEASAGDGAQPGGPRSVPPWLLDRGTSIAAAQAREADGGVASTKGAVDEGKRAERLRRARAMLQEKHVREEAMQRQRQQVAMQKVEEDRAKQMAAIVAHKRALLGDDDD